MALSYDQILEALNKRPKISRSHICFGTEDADRKRGVTFGAALTGWDQRTLLQSSSQKGDIIGYGCYWLPDDQGNGQDGIHMSVHSNGTFMNFSPVENRYGFLVSLPYDLIKSICSYNTGECWTAILPVNELGDIASNQDELTQLLEDGKLTPIDFYPINKYYGIDLERPLEIEQVPIYQTNEGKKYIRLKNNSNIPITYNNRKYNVRW